ncbi:MAG: DUF2157 domain-containing protein [Cyanobacteria bacterium Co-bin13]|nr:DUF2157 domain-containing protein [Cyanobacteria bacterium Co-bin13]
MDSEKFRRQLRQESEQWWQEGLIDTSVYETLAQRYQFQALEGEAKSRFVVILLSLGGILLGLGVITYVAANWQGWPREFRTLLLFALFVAVNGAGFYLWRRSPSQGGQRLGHAMLLLGALILGANLGLTSQMFHQSGNLYELYLVWSLGVLAMAYGLRLASLGVLSLGLMVVGYFLGASDWSSGTISGWMILIEQMPLVMAGLFVPLAYRCRSRVLFGLAAVGVAVSLQGNLGLLLSADSSWWRIAIAVALPPALLWSYTDQIWQWDQPKAMRLTASPTGQPPLPFQAISRVLAVTALSLFLYIVSFHWVWQFRWFGYLTNPSERANSLLLSVVVLGLIAVWGWAKIVRQGISQRQLPIHFINSGSVLACIALATGTAIWHEMVTVPTIGPVVYNLLVFCLALALIRDGLALGTRGMFWGGMTLLVISIMSRTLEYNTDLLLKALAFALCGAGIIIAGLWFERHIKPAHTLQEKPR